MKKADEYLYIGKNNGKNCIVWRENEYLYTKTG
jgi:PleD family two-component response regulator